MPQCSAIKCRNLNKDFKFFSFPKNEEFRKKWIINTGRNFIPTTNSRLCESHFEIDQFEPRRTDKKLLYNAIPTIFGVINPPRIIQILPNNPLIKSKPPEFREQEKPIKPKKIKKLFKYSEHNYADIKYRNYSKYRNYRKFQYKFSNVSMKEHSYANLIKEKKSIKYVSEDNAIVLEDNPIHFDDISESLNKQTYNLVSEVKPLILEVKSLGSKENPIVFDDITESLNKQTNNLVSEVKPLVSEFKSLVLEDNLIDFYNISDSLNKQTYNFVSEVKPLISEVKSLVSEDNQIDFDDIISDSINKQAKNICQCQTYNPYKHKIRKLMKKVRALKLENETLLNNHFYLELDQKQFLSRKKIGKKYTGFKWTNDTVEKCIKVRDMCGKRGYEYLRKSGYPLPSYRTICNRIQVDENKNRNASILASERK